MDHTCPSSWLCVWFARLCIWLYHDFNEYLLWGEPDIRWQDRITNQKSWDLATLLSNKLIAYIIRALLGGLGSEVKCEDSWVSYVINSNFSIQREDLRLGMLLIGWLPHTFMPMGNAKNHDKQKTEELNIQWHESIHF